MWYGKWNSDWEYDNQDIWEGWYKKKISGLSAEVLWITEWAKLPVDFGGGQIYQHFTLLNYKTN